MNYKLEIFAIFLLLQMLMPRMAESKPVPGKKGALGGLALGGLAGMAIGHTYATHQANKKQQQQQEQQQIPPGCIKQTLREPDPQDPTKYVDIERLVCPYGMAPSSYAAPMQNMPGQYVQAQPAAQQPIMWQQQPQQQQPVMWQQQQQPIASLPPQQIPQQQQEQQAAAAPTPPPPPPANDTQGASGINDALLQIQRPGDQQQAAPQSAQPVNPQAPSLPAPAVPAPAMPPPAVPAPVMPSQPNPVLQPSQGNSQVIILSKKPGVYGKSSSVKVMPTNVILILAMTFLFKCFH